PCQFRCGGTSLIRWSEHRGGCCLASFSSLWRGGKRREERFRGVASNEVTVKAVPVVEPQWLSQLLGLPPIQVDVLKIPLYPECPYQGFPEGGLQEIFRLHMQREILHPL